MSAQNTTPVANAKKGSKTPKTPKENRVKRIPFDVASCRSDGKPITDAAGKECVQNGKLITVPVTIPGKLPSDPAIQVGFSTRLHKPLKVGDFVTLADFLEYRATAIESRLAKAMEAPRKLREKAMRFRKFGDEATRKKADKLARAREQVAALEAELAAAGIV
jgi:hypothetical protein